MTPTDAKWLLTLLHADAADRTRDPMWRYGVRHALTLVCAALAASERPPVAPELPRDPGLVRLEGES